VPRRLDAEADKIEVIAFRCDSDGSVDTNDRDLDHLGAAWVQSGRLDVHPGKVAAIDNDQLSQRNAMASNRSAAGNRRHARPIQAALDAEATA
jgi:hypothetical protein